MEEPGFGVSVVLRYFVLPAVLVGLLAIWWRHREGPRRFSPPHPDRLAWVLIAAFWAVYAVMASLRYLAYRTAIQDLGVYDRLLWLLATAPGLPSAGQFISTFGHFSPILSLHVLAYKVWSSALVLLWLQVLAVGLGAYPLYQLARRHVGPVAALVFAAAYLLYPSVVFLVLFDFHPDHLLLPLLLFAFDALDRGRGWVLAVPVGLMLLVKESLVPTAVAFCVYAVVVRRRYLLGAGLAVAALGFFVLVIMRHYAGVFRAGTGGGQSYGYLGTDLASIARTLVLSPGTWLPHVVQVPKLKFVFLMLAPLAFLPLFGPSALVVAVPGVLMSLLSQQPHRYQIWTQYTVPIVPPLFVAAVFGLRRLRSWDPMRRLVPSGDRAAALPLVLLVASLYFNVVFSPSPLSRAFWLGQPEWLRWSYDVRAYVIGDREREIRQALARYVPGDPNVSVSSQNNLNSSHLAHRLTYYQFPAEAEFIVTDVRRPPYLYDRIDPAAFAATLEQVKRRRKVLYESDGFFIFGPGPA